MSETEVTLRDRMFRADWDTPMRISFHGMFWAFDAAGTLAKGRIEGRYA